MAVIGIFRRSPPIIGISFVPQAWITDPEQRNKSDLKKAWVNRWNMPASQPPSPRASIIKPNWLTVE